MVNMLLAGNAQSKVGIFLICPQSNSAKKIRSSAKTRRAAARGRTMRERPPSGGNYCNRIKKVSQQTNFPTLTRNVLSAAFRWPSTVRFEMRSRRAISSFVSPSMRLRRASGRSRPAPTAAAGRRRRPRRTAPAHVPRRGAGRAEACAGRSDPNGSSRRFRVWRACRGKL